MTFAQQHTEIMLLNTGLAEDTELMCFHLALAAMFPLSSAVLLSQWLHGSFSFIQSEECLPPLVTSLIFSDCSPHHGLRWCTEQSGNM